ncbi:MAG TPA: beta-L-arabinofuranosidase domain-containing protein [Trebonia sp.]|nr:beta-L-arabinofuranosidase domain-containing protein [Trebonia sp.]
MTGGTLRRRDALTVLGGAVVLAGDSAYLGVACTGSASPRPPAPDAYSPGASYAPDGTAGKTAAVPRADVRVIGGPFLGNQQRNLAYLKFLDPDRMLRSFRINYGLSVRAAPIGGWESPDSEIRGHVTGHLLSALAWAYAGTGTTAGDADRRAVKAKGDYLVDQLASLQARAAAAGYSYGYLSAFPEQYFTWLEDGQGGRVWSPYYMIHKYLAGLIDQYQLAGNSLALDVATRLADWVDRRTRNLSYRHMQVILETEFGGLPEALANLYAITGDPATLKTAERFYHARFLDPLTANVDSLAGWQCNISTPKVIAALRLAEETGSERYRDAAVNFWRISTSHHAYAIGGQGNHEHWGPPDVVAGALSNETCEGCVSYNMLKLTRLLHFHQPDNPAYLDYYERALVNHLLGAQDPGSRHGFVAYYTGLSAGAHKQVPSNYFPRVSQDIFATDYDTFTCDTATGLEIPTRFTDTIYSRDPDAALRVNLFIPSRVRAGGLTLRQSTRIPEVPATTLAIEAGTASMTLRVRVPAWATSVRATLNGSPLPVARGTGRAGSQATGTRQEAIEVTRAWRPGDELVISFGMGLALRPAPDDPGVTAVAYGPVILAALTGDAVRRPTLDMSSIRQVSASPLAFEATGSFGGRDGGRAFSLIPVGDVVHQRYTTYWQAQ